MTPEIVIWPPHAPASTRVRVCSHMLSCDCVNTSHHLHSTVGKMEFAIDTPFRYPAPKNTLKIGF